MKKLAIAFTLSTLTFCAQAQIASLSACTHISTPRISYQPLGRHLAFVCTDSSGTYVYQDGVSCLHASCNVDGTAAAALRVAQATDKKIAIDKEWTAITWDCNAPPGDAERSLCKERMDWIATWWAEAIKDFKPAVWKVKVNGTALTRPSYTLTNGVLGAISSARAPVGATCDVTKPTVAAPYTLATQDIRAQWLGGPSGMVTICSKVKL